MTQNLKNILYPLAIIGAIVTSCATKQTAYYNHDKWKIPGDINMAPLKASPKEIKESLFTNLTDTSINAKGTLNSINTWRFDAAGNLMYREYFISDEFWIRTEMQLGTNGYQSRSYTNNDAQHTKEDAGKIVSKPISDSSFFEETFSPQNGNSYRLKTFGNNGKIITIEEIKDTVLYKNATSRELLYYEGDKLQKALYSSINDTPRLAHYFYNTNGFLDSIILRQQGAIIQQEFFVNNTQGDPVSYLKINAQGDTLQNIMFTYIYDAKANWIKRLEREETQSRYNAVLTKQTPDYTITEREIKY